MTEAACRSDSNTPWAAAPRACTTRSGMRSWSKCVIFSRRWKSCSRVGPRAPALSEWSVSRSRAPGDVVRNAPCWPAVMGSAPVRRRWRDTVSGASCSGLGGSGSWGAVGSWRGDRCKGRRTGRRRGCAGRLSDLADLAELEADFEGLGDFAAGLMGLAYPGLRLSMHPRRRVCSTSPPGRPPVPAADGRRPAGGPGCAPPPSGRRRP